MKKKTNLRILLSLVGITVAIIAGLLLWKKATQTTIVPFGETFVMDSQKEQDARKKWMLSNFFWHNGKMELTITDSKLYKNPKEAGIEEIYLDSLPPEEENLYFLLVSYKIHNVNATPSFPEGFHSSLLRLDPYHRVNRHVRMPKHMENFLPDTVYCSIFKENVEKDSSILQQPKEGQYYMLEQGDSKEIQIGFYVDKDAYENGQVILTLPTGHDGPVKTALEVCP